MLSITLAAGSERERITRDRLLDLLRKYDLRKWLFTREVRIEEGAVPRSHKVALGIRVKSRLI